MRSKSSRHGGPAYSACQQTTTHCPDEGKSNATTEREATPLAEIDSTLSPAPHLLQAERATNAERRHPGSRLMIREGDRPLSRRDLGAVADLGRARALKPRLSPRPTR